MSLRSRTQGASSTPDPVEPLGTVRRSQLISTYGIGAIIDLEKGSFMPMGLEDWEYATRRPSLTVHEPRLEAMLGVDHFRLGPIAKSVPGSRAVDARSTAPAVRFPEWHECPKCHRIGRENEPFELAADGSRLRCLAHSGRAVYTTPVRLVIACEKGHLSDFAWQWWAHRSRDEGVCDNPSLYLTSQGRSASLGDLSVECRSCATGDKRTSQSLGGSFGAEALRDYSCSGFRPWLRDRQDNCDARVRTLQRGASNIHFPTVCSALSIPPASESAMQIVDEMRDTMDAVPEETIPKILEGVAGRYNIAVEPLLVAWRKLKDAQSGLTGLTEKVARSDEYAALSADRNDQALGNVVPQFRNAVVEPHVTLRQWFDLTGGVSRLREVRAIAGFTRMNLYPVQAEDVSAAIAQGHISPLSKTPRNWLPAAEIRGEGIFLRFDTAAVDSWVDANPGVTLRASQIDGEGAEAADRRGGVWEPHITPRLLLVHSFAHAFIRQISVECGYSTSALRERLYVSEAEGTSPATNGVLVYTGSPDSEGSLGGLVRLAEPDMLKPLIDRTLAAAQWCGSDPVCLETEPSRNGERLNGAACHCCMLLPETACEKFNRELDRAVLIGAADGSFSGFFQTEGR